jgi:SAM-dependent methyltransferase
MEQASTPSKYELYQTSVQNVKKEVEFFKKQYRLIFNKIPTTFREDFCGTALLSCEWVKGNVLNSAVGIDLDQETLEWGIKNNVNNLNSGSERIKLIKQDVLEEYDTKEKFDIICSLNYSHFLLPKRKQLLKYFSNVVKNLESKGVYIIDFYGGSHIFVDHKYQHNKTSNFYEFSGKQMNILNNQSKCSLNYKIKKNKYKPFFSFDFRIYSIIELREAMEEVGFNQFKLFIKEINDDEEDDYAEYEEVDIDGEYYPESERLTGYLIAFINK